MTEKAVQMTQAHESYDIRWWVARGRVFGVFMCLCCVLFAGVIMVPVASADAAVSPEDKARLASAIEVLKAEAGQIGAIKQGSEEPLFLRPHPALVSFGPEMAVPVLIEMLQPLDTRDYRDTYIKWHLLYVVKKATRADRRDVVDRLTRLLHQIPGPINIARREAYDYSPPEIAAKYRTLLIKSRVKTGYPPFVKTYHGRDAIEYVRPGQRAKWTKMADEIDRLRKLWTRTPIPENIAFNKRIDEVKFVVRQYRGELAYELLRSGDPKVLRLISDTIDRNLKARQMIAFDLLAYVYAAGTDGVLTGFEHKDLEAFGGEIKRVARGSADYEKYEVSKTVSPYYSRKRNFADCAFHLIHMLENLDVNALPGGIPG